MHPRPLRFHALACDYDGTIASHGKVERETIAALRELQAGGRRLLLVTGRELDDLRSTFHDLDVFEWIVAENGALLYKPSTGEEKPLAKPPPGDFVRRLREKGVQPISEGRVIVATWEPHETMVLEAIRELGLELQVIFNKGAVMILPAGVNKASGLEAALKEMGLSVHNVVAVGDAENDHAMLSAVECSAAVANALPKVRERADIALAGDHGKGVRELVAEMLKDDLAGREDRLSRHHLLLGLDDDGKKVKIPPHGVNVLVAGTSGGGKSTLTTGLLERLNDLTYQFCIVDPEGDYEEFPGAVSIGNAKHAPASDEVLRLLSSPAGNANVNMIGMPLPDRPAFFLGLLPKLLEMRSRTGRPHWLIVDEAHHMLPGPWDFHATLYPSELDRCLYVTMNPSSLPPEILTTIDVVLAIGQSPDKTMEDFCKALGIPAPKTPSADLQRGEAMAWLRGSDSPPFRIHLPQNRTERRRHSRKYAEGQLSPERSFYFRGPEKKLKLRAQNLILFLQIGDGVDDDTWTHHLRRGDYSAWFREAIKDATMAEEAAAVEKNEGLSPMDSRKAIRELVERHYTLPG
jgi:HAD superfamily hydrolase (TIGR01484 family)